MRNFFLFTCIISNIGNICVFMMPGRGSGPGPGRGPGHDPVSEPEPEPEPGPGPTVETNIELCVKKNQANVILFSQNHCYYCYSNGRRWRGAVKFCESQNMQLVHFETRQEQDEVLVATKRALKTLPPELWIGLKKTNEGSWAWFYKDSLYPVLPPRTRWYLNQIPNNPNTDVAQISWSGTWSGDTKDKTLPFICEDPLSPKHTEAQCSIQWDRQNVKLGPFGDFHCYYVFHESRKSYLDSKHTCEYLRTNLLFLETTKEETWLSNELQLRTITPRYWLGIQENEIGEWNWEYGHKTYPEPNPRVQLPWNNPNVIYNDNKWETMTPDNLEPFVCEDDLFPNLISELICFHHLDAYHALYNPSTQHCYYIYDQVKDFDGARMQCESKASNLIFLEDAAEQNFIEDEMKYYMDNSYGTQTYGLWLGMRKGKHGEWHWIGPGLTKLVEEERWMEPPNGGKHAIAILGSMWSEETKDGLYSCVCEEVVDMDMVNDRICHKFSGSALSFFNYETRSCYYVFKDRKDWTQTRELCTSESTYIVQPNTDEEKSWMMTILTDFGLPVTVWLGKIRTAPGQWSWYYNNHLEVSEMVPNSGIDSADMSYARLTESGQWQRATSTEIYGVVCEDSITPSHLKQARERNVGGDWIYGEAWIEDPVESSTVSNITPTSHSTAGRDPKNSIFGYCPDPKWLSPGSIMDIKYSKVSNVDESVTEIMILDNASNLRCAKTCSFDARCILYTRDKYKTCRGFKADRFSTNRISCSDVSCFLKMCNDAPTAA